MGFVRILARGLLLGVLAGTLDAQEDPTRDQSLTWSDLLGTDSTLKVYGFLRLDTAYDDSRMNDPQIPVWVRSEDPSPPPGVPPGVVAPADESEFTMHARLTRIGLAFSAPRLEALGRPALEGKLEIDFYNIGLGDSDSRNAVRTRLAYLALDWGSWRLLAGQDWDVISPLYPIVNNDLVMWGAGNTGDRRPQLTLTNRAPLGAGEVVSEIGVALTGAVSSATVSGGLRSGENSGRPMVHARVGYHGETDAGAPYQFGVWGHEAEFEFDPTGTGLPESRFDSYSVGVDVRVPLAGDRAWLQAEYWSGENLADIRGGILQGVNATTGAEIEASGGWAELAYRLNDGMTIYGGYAWDNPDDADLAPFQRASNSIPYVAARWRFGSLRFGIEYLDWTTEYVGLEQGDGHRFLGWIAYYF